jgi:Cu+-exporting ATPase
MKERQRMSRKWVAILVAGVLSACGGAAATVPPSSTHPPAGPTAVAARGFKAPGEAAFGDRTVCLVSKEDFTVSPASPKVEYKGKTYYFCCAGCDTKFKENPEKYLKGGGT